MEVIGRERKRYQTRKRLSNTFLEDKQTNKHPVGTNKSVKTSENETQPEQNETQPKEEVQARPNIFHNGQHECTNPSLHP